jgi:nucleoside-diphosphate-sugar epimerase
VNWFVRQALEEGPITIFGDGSIRRDFLYVDDSVEAMLRCATCPAALGEVFNVGTGASQTLLELAQAIVESAGQGRVELVPFSEERRAQEPGDFYCDVSKMTRVVGWESRVGLEVGLAATLKFYRDRRADYW